MLIKLLDKYIFVVPECKDLTQRLDFVLPYSVICYEISPAFWQSLSDLVHHHLKETLNQIDSCEAFFCREAY